MAYPVVATQSNENGASLGSANAIAAPSGVASGDLLLAVCIVYQPNFDDTDPSTGWTQLFQVATPGEHLRHAWFARIADGGANDALSLTGVASDYCAAIFRITGHGVSNVATDIPSATAGTNTNSQANPPSLDAGSSKEWLWLTAASYNWASIGHDVTVVPTNYTMLLLTKSAASASSVGLGVGSRELTTQTEDPGTFTSTNRPWVAATLAVPPAAGGSVTGTLAVTVAGATSAATGTETITGALAVTVVDATSAAAGTETITGTLAVTVAGATSVATGTETITGTLAITVADATSVATGTVTAGNDVSGSLAVTVAGATSAATGTVTITGAANVTLAGAASVATGTVTITGTANVTLTGATSAATGTLTITGTLAVTVAGATSAATGTHTGIGAPVTLLDPVAVIVTVLEAATTVTVNEARSTVTTQEAYTR